MYSSEIESWFVNTDISPNEAYSLDASKSGLLPTKGIEEHPRTVENIVYKSESESDHSSVFESNKDDTIHTEPLPHHLNSSTPVQQNGMSPYDLQPLSPLSWNHPHDNFMRLRMMSDSLLPRVAPVPPKNIAHSSVPCVWSYTSQPGCGIAPHYTSNFFKRLRHRKQSKKRTGSSHNKALHPHPHSNHYHSQPQSQEQTMKRMESKLDEHHHSLYNQFVLLRDPKLEIPTRRALKKIQGHFFFFFFD